MPTTCPEERICLAVVEILKGISRPDYHFDISDRVFYGRTDFQWLDEQDFPAISVFDDAGQPEQEFFNDTVHEEMALRVEGHVFVPNDEPNPGVLGARLLDDIKQVVLRHKRTNGATLDGACIDFRYDAKNGGWQKAFEDANPIVSVGITFTVIYETAVRN